MDLFSERIKKIQRGKVLADKYCLNDNSFFYIIINRHLGDSLKVLKRLKSIKDYYGDNAPRFHFPNHENNKAPIPKRKLIRNIGIITNNSIAGVAKLYSDYYNELIILPQNELDCLEMYAFSGCSIHGNIVCDENPHWVLGGHKETDEGEWLRMCMFGLTELRWRLCIPDDYCKENISMQINQETAHDTSIVLKKFKVSDPSQCVILCPMAKSSSLLQIDVWEKFAYVCKGRGFYVFTNVYGDEKPINGTEALNVGVDVIACLAKNNAHIIGVQSGLTDVLSKLNPHNMIVLNVIKKDADKMYARNMGANDVVNKTGNIIRLRIEHFEEDYVLKLLMDNFH